MLSPNQEEPAYGYAQSSFVTMNMAGRFTGREIKRYGQDVIKHILRRYTVGIFFGQQINFKASLPNNFEQVGLNKAFLYYNRKLFRACDERQYRHFLRDLHLRGQMPQHYLPQGNYVICKLRYRHKPWTELLAISWLTDERQAKVKNTGQLKKVVNYACRLAEVEEMPVVIGGTFRLSQKEVEAEMDGQLCAYTYKPCTPRRKSRMCNVFVCSTPLKMKEVKPLACAKMDVQCQNTAKWINPEDVFYWDPVLADLLMPIETPFPSESPSPNTSVSSIPKIFPARPNKIPPPKPSPIPRRAPAGVFLPTAPVPPMILDLSGSTDSGSPRDDDLTSPSSPEERSQPQPLTVINEVPSDYEAAESIKSGGSNVNKSRDSLTPADEDPPSSHNSTVDAEREEKIFELLEAMMNDKSGTFYVKGEDPPEAAPKTSTPTEPVYVLPGDMTSDHVDAAGVGTVSGSGGLDATEQTIAELHRLGRQAEMACLLHAELGEERQNPDTYKHLYDEELINKTNQCYMS